MSLRLSCLAAAAVLLLGPGLLALGPAAADPVTVEGRTIELVPPLGYCPLDPTDPNQKQLIDGLVADNTGQNLVIGYEAACNELTAYSVGAVPYLQEYSSFMVPLVNGVFQPQVGSRADFLASLAASLPAVDQAMLAKLEADTNASHEGQTQMSGTQFLGVLHQDENAIYLGLIATFTNSDTTVVGATVIAMTLLGDVPISLNIFRPYRSNADIVALLVESSTAMRNLVAANP